MHGLGVLTIVSISRSYKQSSVGPLVCVVACLVLGCFDCGFVVNVDSMGIRT